MFKILKSLSKSLSGHKPATEAKKPVEAASKGGVLDQVVKGKAPAAAPVAPPPPPPPAPVVAAPTPNAKPPAPAPAPVVAPAPTQDASADVQAAVNKWARDWANRNPDAYLAAYSKSFRPEDGTARSAWAETRRERLTTPRNIKVELLGTTVEMTSPTEAKVTFRQAYSSDALHTKTRKTLTLVKEGQRWLISRERVG